MPDFRERTVVLLICFLFSLGVKLSAATEHTKHPPLFAQMVSATDEDIWLHAYASSVLPPRWFLLHLTHEIHATELDCSHFVHELYERSGLPYVYAPSRDLYDGVGEFRRVFNPEAGDLIVWRGHVGIVTDPEEHLFFSALRSGVKVAAYDSRYWKRKGRPRFFRYRSDETQDRAEASPSFDGRFVTVSAKELTTTKKPKKFVPGHARKLAIVPGSQGGVPH